MQERYDAYSDDVFKMGVYNSFADDFKSALYEYINYKQRLLNDFGNTEGDKVYVISADDYKTEGTICKSLDKAIEIVRENLHDESCTIIKRGINGVDEDITFIELNEEKVITDVSNYRYEKAEYNIQNAFAQIFHKYKAGDIIKCNEKYAVVADVTMYDTKPAYMSHRDHTDMCLYCMSYYDDIMHSCGGYFWHDHFPILMTEICSENELQEKYKPLIALSKALKGESRFVGFLEAYSDRRL